MSASPETRPDAYRFLIVDDSRAIQAIVRRVVETIGYPDPDIRIANNGEEALSLLENFKPLLVITDWHMPKVSGLELLQSMRQYGMSDIKVGFITTESSETMLNQARISGASFVINKPFKDDILIKHVKDAIPLPKAGKPSKASAPTPDASEEPAPVTAVTEAIAAAEARAVAPPAPLAAAVAEEPEFPAPVISEPEFPAPVMAEPEPAPEPAPAPAPAAAAAPPKKEPESRVAGPLISPDAIQKLVHSMLNEIPFRIIKHETLHPKELSAKNLVGLFAGTNKPVAALCVLDTNALCIIGGGTAKLPPHIVRAAMAAAAPTEAMVQNATRFMQSAGAMLDIASEPGAVPLSRTSLVPNNFKKLEEVLLKNSGRADFRISVPGYGDGRFSFLAV